MAKEPEVIDVDAPAKDEDESHATLAVTEELLPDSLLIVPLHDRPLFPRMMGPVLVGLDELKAALAEQLQSGSQPWIGLTLLRTSEDDLPGTPESPEDYHTMGVAAKVVQASQQPDSDILQLVVQVVQRFTVEKVLSPPPVYHATVEYWPDEDPELDDEIKAYSGAVIDSIKELVQLNPLYKEGLSLILDRMDANDPGVLADFSASLTTASGEELQAILDQRDVRKRIEQTLILVKRELEITKLKAQISKRIDERLSKQQREFFLKQQLQEIKKELGLTKEGSEAEVEKLQARLTHLTLSDEAKERIEEELQKLKLLEPSSPEFNVTRAYLDWLTVLPWGVYTEDNYDIKSARTVLDEDHYGLDDVKDRILELISVGIVKGDLAGSIILLVGPPGVGKTSVGQSIARSLGRSFYRFSVGGMRDEAEIKGHRRTYIGAMPGKFLQAMKTCKTANPLIMLDEVDKIGASFRGDPASALLEVLDPEQNRDFLDHYLDVRFDLSKVLFVCTANQLETIPRPLLDRMEVIRISGYILEEKLEIARRHLIPKQLKEHGLEAEQVALSEDVIRAIIDGYAREAGVRGLENSIKKILRKATMSMVEEGTKEVTVGVEDLHRLLGKRVFSEEMVFDEPRVGVVMGLAYTALGGATLYIEATPVPAKAPSFKQTGQLGSVMVESSEIAYTFVRSLLSDDAGAREFFESSSIHLHVPSGATPKDGPSAGITMACALYSLARDRAIIDNVALTGELSLSGMVMPIGGLKEKVIAAKRVDVGTLVFPEENREDFEDLPEHVREGITAHFVSTFDDVRAICFPEE